MFFARTELLVLAVADFRVFSAKKETQTKLGSSSVAVRDLFCSRPIGACLMYRSIPKPPMPPPPPPPRPGQTPGHWTFLKNFGQISRYVASLDGQMPHPLELQRGSNPLPSRHVTYEINEYKQNRLTLETSSAKFSATTNFLVSFSSLHT